MIPQSIIKKLYQVFRHYKADELHVFSPLNDVARMALETKNLQSKTLTELKGEQLAYFAFKTMTTWGSVDDFKHFLPRLLELAPDEPVYLDLPALLRKLDYAHWQSWPLKEQAAVQDYFITYWRALITSGKDHYALDSTPFLSAALDAGFAPASLLEPWQLIDSEPDLHSLVEFILSNYRDIFVHNQFGNDKTKQEGNARLLQNWLCSSAMLEKLTRHFFQFENTSLAEDISEALKHLEDWKKRNVPADSDPALNFE